MRRPKTIPKNPNGNLISTPERFVFLFQPIKKPPQKGGFCFKAARPLKLFLLGFVELAFNFGTGVGRRLAVSVLRLVHVGIVSGTAVASRQSASKSQNGNQREKFFHLIVPLEKKVEIENSITSTAKGNAIDHDHDDFKSKIKGQNMIIQPLGA